MEFNEYLIKKNKSPGEVLLSICLYAAATVLALLCIVLLSKFGGIGFLLAFGCYYFAYKLSSRLNKEFEYIRTDDILDIDVILNASLRKRLISFSVKDVQIIASVKNPVYKDKLKECFGKVIDATSARRDANVYFAIINGDKRTLVKFEPPYSILSNLHAYAPSKVIIDD